MTDHLKTVRDLVAAGEEADQQPLAYGCFGDKDDSLYLATVYDERDEDTILLAGRHDLNELDETGREFVPYEFLDRIMLAEAGDSDKGIQAGYIPFFCAAANARPALAALLRVVEAAKAFQQHETKCQQNQDAGKLKDHIVKRLELLAELYAALRDLSPEVEDE